MNMSRSFCEVVSFGAVVIALAAIVPAHAEVAAAPSPSTEQLVSSVLTLKQIKRLNLTQGQLREIVQHLSTLSHAQQVFAGHQTDAARPVLEPLRRIKAAMQAGNTPDAADQTAVDNALAGLRTEQVHVEQLRSETISAIRQILTRAQIDTLRSFLGMGARGAPQHDNRYRFMPNGRAAESVAAPGGAVGGPPVAVEAAPGADTLPPPQVVPGAAYDVPMTLRVSIAGRTAAVFPANNKTRLLNARWAIEEVAQDRAAEPRRPASIRLVQVAAEAQPDTAAPAAGTPEAPAPLTTVLIAAPPAAANADGLEARMARLEAQMEQLRAMVQAMMPGNGVHWQPAPALHPPAGDAVGVPPVQMMALPELGQPLRPPWVVPQAAPQGGGPFGGWATASASSSDDDAIARFFFQPDVLTDLRDLAAR